VEHLRHFGLDRDPFVKDPLPGFHHECDSQRDAELRLLRAVVQRRGLLVLTGGIGLGKTTVLRRLLSQLDEERFEASLLVLVHGAEEPTWLMSRLAALLGVPSPPRERGALCAEVHDRLAALHEEGRHAVLLVDDAQLLARSEPLAELRGLLNLEHENEHLLTVVLAGRSDLDMALGMEAGIAQRVDGAARLMPVDPEGVAALLAHRVRVAGGPAGLFDPAAARAVARLSGGVPRVVLSLADNALHEAWLAGAVRVEEPHVARAAQDLQLALSALPPEAAAIAAGTGSDAGLPVPTRDHTEPEIAPLFEDLEPLDSTMLLPENGPPKDEDELETLLEDEAPDR